MNRFDEFSVDEVRVLATSLELMLGRFSTEDEKVALELLTEMESVDNQSDSTDETKQ